MPPENAVRTLSTGRDDTGPADSAASNCGSCTDSGGLPASVCLGFLIWGEQQNLTGAVWRGLATLMPGKCLAHSEHELMWTLGKQI